jgi:hypothetical protein
MQELIEGLKKQFSIYEKLLEKTLQEKEAFNNKDNKSFMSALSERLHLMNDVNLIEEKLKPLREKWIKEKDSFSDTFNKNVIDLVKNIKELMDDILEYEKSIIDGKIKEQQDVTTLPKGKAISRYKKV